MSFPIRNEEKPVLVQAESEIDPDMEPLLMAAMISNAGFTSNYRTVISGDLFRNPDFGFLCGVLLEFYDEFRQSPSTEVLVDLVRRSSYRARGSVVDFVRAASPVDNVDYISKRILDWARWQRVTEVMESDDRSDPRAFGLRVEEASRTGEHLKGGEIVMGHGVVHDDTSFERPKVRTPWSWLNDRLRGGPEYGDLCVIESFINVGKTTMLVNIGTAALGQGELVCYGVFEDGEHNIRRRFTQCITNFTQDDLLEWTADANKRVDEFFEQTGGKLHIKRLRSRRTSVEDFAGWVRSVQEREGRECRVAISDYADRYAAPRRRSEDRQEYREIFEECKLMAGDLDLIHWTALQSNRQSSGQDVIGLEFTGESIGKVEGADLVLGTGQTAEDVHLGFVNLFTAKMRNAKKHEQLRLRAEMERQRIYDPSNP